MTLRAFLTGHIAALREVYDVTVVANAGSEAAPPPELGEFVSVPIERRIAPWKDLRALACLVALFARRRFDVVHSVTPKAGLLAMTAAWIARIPVRIHIFTGQVWATRKGPARFFLRALDRVIAGCASHVLVDSGSQRQFLIANRVVSAAKSKVLGKGSICGVDERFRPDQAVRDRVRSALGLFPSGVLFLYVGRLSRDKGVIDLATVFAEIAAQHSSAFLLIVGPDEEGLTARIREILARHLDRLRSVDFTDRPEDYMAAADVFCLPSYREGFGQVAIEASAAELPVVASRIYGVTDAVVERETGLFHAPGDVAGLREAMLTLLEQPELRRRLGRAGRARAVREFSAERVTRALLDYYSELSL